MCGRFTLKTPVGDWLANLFPELAGQQGAIVDELRASSPETLEPRYNIAPSQSVLVGYHPTDDSLPIIAPMRWGLVPFWAATPEAGYKMINARSETLFEKTTFKQLVPDHRCVVLADGYYEWQSPERSGGKNKQPYWIYGKNENVFAMAGLWTENRKIFPDRVCRSVTIVTSAANADTESVHDRMPIILHNAASVRQWLEPAADPSDLKSLLVPGAQGGLFLRPVSTLVNSPRHDGPDLIATLK